MTKYKFTISPSPKNMDRHIRIEKFIDGKVETEILAVSKSGQEIQYNCGLRWYLDQGNNNYFVAYLIGKKETKIVPEKL